MDALTPFFDAVKTASASFLAASATFLRASATFLRSVQAATDVTANATVADALGQLLGAARAGLASNAAASSTPPITDALGGLLGSLGAAVEREGGPGAARYLAGTVACAAPVLLLVACRRTRGAASKRKKNKGGGGGAKPHKAKPPKKPKPPPKVRICRFCEVEVADAAYMERHLAGKKHRKQAEGVAPDECWVWVEKPVAAAAEAPVETPPTDGDARLPRATAATADDGAWQTVATGAAKRRAAKKPDKNKAAAAPTDAPADAPAPLRIHRRCDECDARARDGATVETDPDDESKAYCTECWDRWRTPPPPAPAPPPPAPKTHTTVTGSR